MTAASAPRLTKPRELRDAGRGEMIWEVLTAAGAGEGEHALY